MMVLDESISNSSKEPIKPRDAIHLSLSDAACLKTKMDKEAITDQRNGIIHKKYILMWRGKKKTPEIPHVIFCLLNEATTSEHILYKYYVVYNY